MKNLTHSNSCLPTLKKFHQKHPECLALLFVTLWTAILILIHMAFFIGLQNQYDKGNYIPKELRVSK